MWPFKRKTTPTILVEVKGGEVQDVLADAPVNVRVIVLDHDEPCLKEYNPPRVEKGWSIERLDKMPPSDRSILWAQER